MPARPAPRSAARGRSRTRVAAPAAPGPRTSPTSCRSHHLGRLSTRETEFRGASHPLARSGDASVPQARNGATGCGSASIRAMPRRARVFALPLGILLARRDRRRAAPATRKSGATLGRRRRCDDDGLSDDRPRRRRRPTTTTSRRPRRPFRARRRRPRRSPQAAHRRRSRPPASPAVPAARLAAGSLAARPPSAASSGTCGRATAAWRARSRPPGSPPSTTARRPTARSTRRATAAMGCSPANVPASRAPALAAASRSPPVRSPVREREQLPRQPRRRPRQGGRVEPLQQQRGGRPPPPAPPARGCRQPRQHIGWRLAARGPVGRGDGAVRFASRAPSAPSTSGTCA